MSDVEDLLSRLVIAMRDIQETLTEISGKLDNINGIYSLDDLVEKMESGVQTVIGPTCYDLTDIHADLKEIANELLDIKFKLD